MAETVKVGDMVITKGYVDPDTLPDGCLGRVIDIDDSHLMADEAGPLYFVRFTSHPNLTPGLGHTLLLRNEFVKV